MSSFKEELGKCFFKSCSMKCFLANSFFLFISCICLAQVPTQGSGGMVTGSNVDILDTNRFSISAMRKASKSELSYDEIEGSPYIDNNTGAANNLPIGKFYTPEFTYLETALARYNAYTDNMEVSPLDDAVTYYFLKKEPNFFYVVLNEKKYRAYEYDEGIGYFIILSKDDLNTYTLLKKESVEFKKAKKAESSFVTDSPDHFQRARDRYYLKIETRIVEIPRKKKDFYLLFGQAQQQIKEYIKQHSLKINKEEDLLKISNYGNTLVSK